jgi:hypothetical protein
MYYAVIGIAFAVMIAIGAYVEQAAGAVRAENFHQNQQTARLYMRQAEDALNDQIALTEKAIQSGSATDSVFTPGNTWQMPEEYGQGQQAYCPTSANATATCSWKMSWIATLDGSTSATGGATNETSENVNSDVDEQRLSFLLKVNEQTSGVAKTIYTMSETVTMRVYAFSPYASIVSKTNAKEFYAGSWGTNASTEGDTSGCGGGTCGADTSIHSYDQCQTDPTQTVPATVQAQWCNANPKTTTFNHTIANPQDNYVNTSSMSSPTWQNRGTAVTP